MLDPQVMAWRLSRKLEFNQHVQSYDYSGNAHTKRSINGNALLAVFHLVSSSHFESVKGVMDGVCMN